MTSINQANPISLANTNHNTVQGALPNCVYETNLAKFLTQFKHQVSSKSDCGQDCLCIKMTLKPFVALVESKNR